jgi:hypothetical protein
MTAYFMVLNHLKIRIEEQPDDGIAPSQWTGGRAVRAHWHIISFSQIALFRQSIASFRQWRPTARRPAFQLLKTDEFPSLTTSKTS